jgi:hypothetical protein|tara:strand:+ start:2040 stop:2249 length:210 start_codon:yes stop_codon:yes gene_type:complete
MNTEMKLKQWEETMADANEELKSARGSGNKDAIREAQDVWHWAKAKLDEAATEVVKLQMGLTETSEEEE